MRAVRGRVLIVDDDPDVFTIVASLFSQTSCTCVHAQDGAEALEILTSQDFDLILSDWMMPGMDGEEFFLKLKAEQPELLPRFVLFSVASDAPRFQEFVRASGCAWTERPFSKGRVKTLLQRIKPEKDPPPDL